MARISNFRPYFVYFVLSSHSVSTRTVAIESFLDLLLCLNFELILNSCVKWKSTSAPIDTRGASLFRKIRPWTRRTVSEKFARCILLTVLSSESAFVIKTFPRFARRGSIRAVVSVSQMDAAAWTCDRQRDSRPCVTDATARVDPLQTNASPTRQRPRVYPTHSPTRYRRDSADVRTRDCVPRVRFQRWHITLRCAVGCTFALPHRGCPRHSQCIRLHRMRPWGAHVELPLTPSSAPHVGHTVATDT